jgi:hypothetical protein
VIVAGRRALWAALVVLGTSHCSGDDGASGGQGMSTSSGSGSGGGGTGNTNAGSGGVGEIEASSGGAGNANGGAGDSAGGGSTGEAGGVGIVIGGPTCPPATSTTENPAGCPEAQPVAMFGPETDPANPYGACDTDSALICGYWTPTQNSCPQSSLLPLYFKCCGGEWQTSPAPSITCSSEGADAGP